jgi:hypothetical protein
MSKILNRSSSIKRFRQTALQLFLLLGCLPALTGCDRLQNLLPNTPAPTAGLAATRTPDNRPTPLPPAPLTSMVFTMQAPENTPPGSDVFLVILDEVTGLALNPLAYKMQPIENRPNFYTMSLPYALGSAITYRYERQAGGIRVNEHTADGAPVRYRLVHVEGPGAVEDVVSRWTDTPFIGKSGRIQGKALDDASGQPIPGLLVAAGGAQAFTTSDGSFLIEGLPAGVHNLVIFALDGAYHTYQQGARVAADSTTPTPVKLTAAPMVNLVFTTKLPTDTPPIVPIRLAGSLFQLGNTFASLSGGVSSLAANMPVLSRLPDGRYSLTLTLPSGADLRYKYTLGDGFWNAERTAQGDFKVRQVVVPETSAIIEDEIATWHVPGKTQSIIFDTISPVNTPPDDSVSIQFNPLFGWMESLPAWPLGDNRWAYILYNPLNLGDSLSYRYCRNGQCGRADDQETPGLDDAGRPINLNDANLIAQDEIKGWVGLGDPANASQIISATVSARGPTFTAGLEFSSNYHPSWKSRLPNILGQAQEYSPNWLVFTPSWTYSRSNPLVFGINPGQDPLWQEMIPFIEQARQRKTSVAIFPTPHFVNKDIPTPASKPLTADDWWRAAPHDFGWWLVWFSQYNNFALHHADMAARSGAGALILGGEWVKPALPNGKLVDGSPSSVPLDAESRWRDLISQIRSRYAGKLYWAMSYKDIQSAPDFLNAVDGIYLLWDAPLTKDVDAPEAKMYAEAARRLDAEIAPLQARLNKPLILAVSYSSADGSAAGCKPDTLIGCQGLDFGDHPGPELNLAEQVHAYNAVIKAVAERDWINGLVSRDYYPPAALQDKSASIHGKPAGSWLKAWFEKLLPPFAAH